jgi:Right handed beta helix region
VNGSHRSISRLASRSALVPALVLTLVLALAAPGHAALLTVCGSGCTSTTIQGALLVAADGDTIRVEDTQPHTEADIVVDRSVTIEGVPGSGTIVQAATTAGTFSGRVLVVPTGMSVLVRDLQLRYGSATSEGGGIFNQGDLTLERVVVRNNQTSDTGDPNELGGGIYNIGNLRMRDCLVDLNYAGFEGGGIFNAAAGTLIATDLVMISNDAFEAGGGVASDGEAILVRADVRQGSAGAGGGLYSSGQLLFSGRLMANLASFGGSLFESGGEVEILNSSILTSSAEEGGGVFVDSGRATFIDTTIRDNGAETGAGIAQYSSTTLRIRTSTISRNEASGQGGGIYVAARKHVDLSSTTIADNVAHFGGTGSGNGGGGIYIAPCVGTCSTDYVELRNSIVSGNVDESPSGTPADDCSGYLTSAGYNLVERASTGAIGPCRIGGDLAGVLVETDPLLGNLGQNGGTPVVPGAPPPFTHTLQPGSPAVDAGDPAGCADSGGVELPRDQRGALRSERCDMGSFERGSIPRLFADGFDSGDDLFWRTP